MGSKAGSVNLNSGNLAMSTPAPPPNCLAIRSNSDFSSRSVSGVESTNAPPLCVCQGRMRLVVGQKKNNNNNLLRLGLVVANFVQEQLLNGIAHFLGGRDADAETATSLHGDSARTKHNGFGQHL